MSKIKFLSHILDSKTPCYGGKGNISIDVVRQISNGDSCNQMHWSFSNHAGTHMDFPRHFIAKGKTVDAFDAPDCIFEKVQLIDLKKVNPGKIIDQRDLSRLSERTELVLIRTGFEKKRKQNVYWQDSPALHPDLAGYLKDQCPKLRAVGMDFISISNINQREMGRKAHRQFLGRGILLIEDMKLSGLKGSPKKVLAAPVRVRGADGSPCTVFCWE